MLILLRKPINAGFGGLCSRPSTCCFSAPHKAEAIKITFVRPKPAAIMTIGSFIVHTAERFRLRFHQFIFRHMFPPQLQVSFPGSQLDVQPQEQGRSIFEEFIWMAGPKSKISPARKREKHGRFIPDRKGWHECERCGSARLPHRICKAHMNICAMRKEEWLEYKKTHGTVLEPKQNV